MDLEQREGRAIRQGNQNAEVEILNYVTEGSFDTFMWQKVEAKAMFIEQIKRNEVDATEVDDIGGEFTASAAETKAASTGDPRYIQQVKLTDEVARLRWCAGRGPSPAPLVVGVALDERGRGWFVASEVPGTIGCGAASMFSPIGASRSCFS